MIWVPVGDPPGNNWSGGSRNDVNRLGSWLGLMSQSDSDSAPPGPSAGDILSAERHGERVARIAARWATGTGYQTARIGEARARAQRRWTGRLDGRRRVIRVRGPRRRSSLLIKDNHLGFACCSRDVADLGSRRAVERLRPPVTIL